MSAEAATKYTKADFTSDQDVRWCPGCGDYAILSAVQKALPDLGIAKENVVFISGIGCSSRFPYYLDTYGFHTIHGRAPALASGLRAANPELSVWVITGDGDGLSIGGNHLLHALRRNVDFNVILFNNEIYGLTKGQYSPTSRPGTTTKSSPFGSQDHPVNPFAFSLGSGTCWYARTIDRDLKHMSKIIKAAPENHGTSMIEILQNCIVFNDGIYEHLYDRKTKHDHLVYLEDGEPMLFGKDGEHALTIRNGELVPVAADTVVPDEIAVHRADNIQQAWMLAQLTDPVPLGILYDVPRPVYEDELLALEADVVAQQGQPDLNALIRNAVTWEVP